MPPESPDLRPAVPPPGTAAVFPLTVLTAAGGDAELSGIIVHGDGRLTIAHRGAGFAVRLDGETATQLALMLFAMGGDLLGKEKAAADGAADALARISGGAHG
jgi:hypothetical protein